MLFPMQVRTNSITLNDCPIFLTDHPTVEIHAIMADDEWVDKVVLPLCLSGFTYYLPIHLLNYNEWNRCETPWVTLTNKHLTWEPSSTDYEYEENDMADFRGNFLQKSFREGTLDNYLPSEC